MYRRGGPGEKSRCCSSRELGFGGQLPHGSGSVVVVPVPEDEISFPSVYGHQAHKWYTYIDQTVTNKIKTVFKKNVAK